MSYHGTWEDLEYQYYYAPEEDRVYSARDLWSDFHAARDVVLEYHGDFEAWLEDSINCFDVLRTLKDINKAAFHYLKEGYTAEWHELSEYYHENGPEDEEALNEWLYNELYDHGFPDDAVDYAVTEFNATAKKYGLSPDFSY